MARQRAFDEGGVLTAAMHAFRRDGYTRTSVPKLEAATGLSVGSLYNAYGDKAGLYRAALDHYVRTFIGPRLDTYAGPDATLDDVEQLALSLFEPPLNDGYGCLVTNAATEIAADAAVAPDGVRAGLAAMREHVADVLARELPAEHAEAATTRLVLIYQGLLVLARAGALGPEHADAVRSEFDRLRALAAHTDPGGDP